MMEKLYEELNFPRRSVRRLELYAELGYETVRAYDGAIDNPVTQDSEGSWSEVTTLPWAALAPLQQEKWRTRASLCYLGAWSPKASNPRAMLFEGTIIALKRSLG